MRARRASVPYRAAMSGANVWTDGWEWEDDWSGGGARTGGGAILVSLAPARLETRRRQHASNECSLPSGICTAIMRVCARKTQLQGLILGTEFLIPAEGIAKDKPLPPEIAPGLGEVKTEPWLSPKRLEVMGDGRAVQGVRIPQAAQWLERCACPLEIADASNHVNDRLRRNPGNRRQANGGHHLRARKLGRLREGPAHGRSASASMDRTKRERLGHATRVQPTAADTPAA